MRALQEAGAAASSRHQAQTLCGMLDHHVLQQGMPKGSMAAPPVRFPAYYCPPLAVIFIFGYRYSCHRPQDAQGGSGSLAGYDTPIALAQAVTDWADGVHGTALSIIAAAMVGARGGIAANRTSRILLFEFTLGDDTSDSGNPAEAFSLTNVSIVHKDEVYAMISSWDDFTAERQRKKEWFRRRLPPHETLLDIMPAVSRVVGTNHAATHYYPIIAL